ncbi:MAG: trehalose-phosphatase [Verrucomicrobia bacterium]|nr:MAG: trehalose-phosphatase [Verrucomicrobiota bacterium]
MIRKLPSALEHVQEIAAADSRQLAVFLDYDGTLTPIVSHPEKALLADSMRETVRALAARAPVCILSGRDLDDVRQRVNIDAIVYAGSHGFDVGGSHGLRNQVATECLPILDAAEKELRQKLAGVPGTLVERKRFSVAAHYRNVHENDVEQVKRIVDEIAARHRELRTIENKKVYELQPDIDWSKGRALVWLLESLGLDRKELFPIYIGDDRTDEDAFGAIWQCGAGILVSEQPRLTAARYALKNPAEVESFLRELAATLT